MAVTVSSFGKAMDGQDLSLYSLKNEKGMEVKVTNLGATLVSVLVPDKKGISRDVVLGHDTAKQYYENGGYFGAVIGRSGNRIANAAFAIDGKTYHLAANDGVNNLHSGPDGFEKRTFDVTEVTENSIRLHVLDANGQQGYPGAFEAFVTYTLTDENELILHYEAVCDQDTPVNLTNHTYFNLGGHDSGTVLDQELWLSAKEYTPVYDPAAIPTGELASVAGTPMDFTAPKAIGKEIHAPFEQLKFFGGYDHNFVLKHDKGEFALFARVTCPQTGIVLEASTDLPGVQFYTTNTDTLTPGTGKGGASYGRHSGFCLETQYFPNSINQEGFARPLLKAGERFESTTSYRFSVKA